ncbi:MAG: hypothetical protein AB4206_14245 [Xenococcaceae cyanobacterium]
MTLFFTASAIAQSSKSYLKIFWQKKVQKSKIGVILQKSKSKEVETNEYSYVKNKLY